MSRLSVSRGKQEPTHGGGGGGGGGMEGIGPSSMQGFGASGFGPPDAPAEKKKGVMSRLSMSKSKDSKGGMPNFAQGPAVPQVVGGMPGYGGGYGGGQGGIAPGLAAAPYPGAGGNGGGGGVGYGDNYDWAAHNAARRPPQAQPAGQQDDAARRAEAERAEQEELELAMAMSMSMQARHPCPRTSLRPDPMARDATPALALTCTDPH